MVEVPVVVCVIVGMVTTVMAWMVGKAQKDATERISEFQRSIAQSTIASERAMLKESMSVYREAYQRGLSQGLSDAIRRGRETDDE